VVSLDERRDDRSCRLIVLAKEPRAGLVKTRLCPPFSPAEAADLALAALGDTLGAVRSAVPLARLRGLRLDPVLVLEGRAGVWLDELRAEAPARLRVIVQRSGPLDARIAGAFQDATAGCAGSCAFLIGMDTPQLSAEMLVGAIDALVATDTGAVLGLAEDGGWWGLGLRQPDASLILGVPTSTPRTGREQLSRLAAARLQVKALPRLRDVDTAADAAHVAALAPDGQFAATLGRLSGKGIPAHV
jgi:glycosyltransferase A (GT-A) superfamily protein (DUF2064 family)